MIKSVSSRMYISPSHPRATSLKIRERLVWGVKKGITSTAGLLAHGRGEAFDYLLGEKTHDFAKQATEAAAFYLLSAKNPVISVNGNTACLVPKELVQLARLLNCKIEVNLFHYSKKRTKNIEKYLSLFDSHVVLKSGTNNKITFPYIASPRKIMLQEGIASADVVFIPLEDGDRAEALIKLGKKVITCDLNPLSRTAQVATITIVDNIKRVLPLLIKQIRHISDQPSSVKLNYRQKRYDNKKTLSQVLSFMKKRLTYLSKEKNG